VGDRGAIVLFYRSSLAETIALSVCAGYFFAYVPKSTIFSKPSMMAHEVELA
jgi:hypothetical protein